MALWLAAVIVLIAVGVMPSGAQAHGTHPHGQAGAVPAALPAPAMTDAVRIADSDAVIARAPLGFAKSLGVTKPLGLTNPAVRFLTAEAVVANSCDGACCNGGCRSPGSCCTGAGLAPDAADQSAPGGAHDRALARALPARTDVVPEALPEPPRFRA